VSPNARSSDAASASFIRGRSWSSIEPMGGSLAEAGLRRARAVIAIALLLLLTGAYAPTQSQSVSPITPPTAALGANVGDDYFLATYSQLETYWKTLAQESDRIRLVDIGRTEEGRTQWMAIVSSPQNLQKLDEYQDISRRLSLAEGLNDSQARALAARGKAVVWIDGGLHANEVLGAFAHSKLFRNVREKAGYLGESARGQACGYLNPSENGDAKISLTREELVELLSQAVNGK